MYGVWFTTTAIEGPERMGSARGVPVPRRTIFELNLLPEFIDSFPSKQDFA
jgi:hypothetical protein